MAESPQQRSPGVFSRIGSWLLWGWGSPQSSGDVPETQHNSPEDTPDESPPAPPDHNPTLTWNAKHLIIASAGGEGSGERSRGHTSQVYPEETSEDADSEIYYINYYRGRTEPDVTFSPQLTSDPPDRQESDTMGRRRSGKKRRSSQGDGGGAKTKSPTTSQHSSPAATSLARSPKAARAESVFEEVPETFPECLRGEPPNSPEAGRYESTAESEWTERHPSDTTEPVSSPDGPDPDMDEKTVVRLTETPESKRRSLKVSHSEKFFPKKVLVTSKPHTEDQHENLKEDTTDSERVKVDDRARCSENIGTLKVKPKMGRIADKISLFESQASGSTNPRRLDSSPARNVFTEPAGTRYRTASPKQLIKERTLNFSTGWKGDEKFTSGVSGRTLNGGHLKTEKKSAVKTETSREKPKSPANIDQTDTKSYKVEMVSILSESIENKETERASCSLSMVSSPSDETQQVQSLVRTSSRSKKRRSKDTAQPLSPTIKNKQEIHQDKQEVKDPKPFTDAKTTDEYSKPTSDEVTKSHFPNDKPKEALELIAADTLDGKTKRLKSLQTDAKEMKSINEERQNKRFRFKTKTETQASLPSASTEKNSQTQDQTEPKHSETKEEKTNSIKTPTIQKSSERQRESQMNRDTTVNTLFKELVKPDPSVTDEEKPRSPEDLKKANSKIPRDPANNSSSSDVMRNRERETDMKVIPEKDTATASRNHKSDEKEEINVTKTNQNIDDKLTFTPVKQDTEREMKTMMSKPKLTSAVRPCDVIKTSERKKTETTENDRFSTPPPASSEVKTKPPSASSEVKTTPPSASSEVKTTPPPASSEVKTTPPPASSEVKTTPPPASLEVKTKPPPASSEVKTTPPPASLEVKTKPPSASSEVKTKPPSASSEVKTTPPPASSEVKTTPPPASSEVKTTPPPASSEVKTTPPPASSEVKTTPPPASLEVKTKPPPASSEVKTTPPPASLEVKTKPPPASSEVKTTPPPASLEVKTKPPSASSEVKTTPPPASSEVKTTPPPASSEVKTTPPPASSEVKTTPPPASSDAKTTPPPALSEVKTTPPSDTKTTLPPASSEVKTTPPPALSEVKTTPPSASSEVKTTPPSDAKTTLPPASSEVKTTLPPASSEVKTTPPPVSLHAKTTPPPASSEVKTTPPPASSDAKTTPPPASSDVKTTPPPASSEVKTTLPPASSDAKTTPPPASSDVKTTPPPASSEVKTTPPSDAKTTLPPASSEVKTTPPPVSSHAKTTPPPASSEVKTTPPPASSEVKTTPPPASSEVKTTPPPVSSDAKTTPPPASSEVKTTPPPVSSDAKTTPPSASSEVKTTPPSDAKTTPPPASSYTKTTPPPLSSEVKTTPPPASSEVKTAPSPASSEAKTTPPPASSNTKTTPPPGLSDTKTTPPPASSDTKTTPPPGLSDTKTTPPPASSDTKTTPLPGLSDTKTTPPPLSSEVKTTPPPASSEVKTTPPPASSEVKTTPPLVPSDAKTTPPPASSEVKTTPPPASSDTKTTPPPASSELKTTPPLASSEVKTTPPPASSEVKTTHPPVSSEVKTTPPPASPVSSEIKTTPPPASSEAKTTPPPASSVAKTTPPPASSEVKTTPPPASSEVKTTPPPASSDAKTTPPPASSEATTIPPPASSEVKTTPPPASSEVKTAPPPALSEVKTTPPPASSEVKTTPPSGSSEVKTTSPPVSSDVKTTPPPASSEAKTTPPPASSDSKSTPVNLKKPQSSDPATRKKEFIRKPFILPQIPSAPGHASLNRDSPSSWLDVERPVRRKQSVLDPKPKLSSSVSETNLLKASKEFDPNDFISNVKRLAMPFTLPQRRHKQSRLQIPPFVMPPIREDRNEKPFDPEEFQFGLRRRREFTLDLISPKGQKEEVKEVKKEDDKPKRMNPERESILTRSVLFKRAKMEQKEEKNEEEEKDSDESKTELVQVKSRLERCSILKSLRNPMKTRQKELSPTDVLLSPTDAPASPSQLTPTLESPKQDISCTQSDDRLNVKPDDPKTTPDPEPPLANLTVTMATQPAPPICKTAFQVNVQANTNGPVMSPDPKTSSADSTVAMVTEADALPPLPSFNDIKLPGYLEKFLTKEPETVQTPDRTDSTVSSESVSVPALVDLNKTVDMQTTENNVPEIPPANISAARGFHRRPGKMVIYQQHQFSGQSFDFYRDETDATHLQLSSVISVKVIRGCWILFEKAGFEGRCIALEEEDIMDLPNEWAEGASVPFVIGSIRLAVRDYTPPRMELFSELEGRGRCTEIVEDTAEVFAFGLPQNTGSIKVHSGLWMVYSDPGFQGLLAVLEAGEYPCPESWGFPEPAVGSVRALRMGGLKVQNPNAVKAVLYEKAGLQGRCVEIQTDVFSFRRTDGESHGLSCVSSLKILGGLWVGYDQEGFDGQQYVLEEGEYLDWRDWSGSGQNLLSLRPVLTDFSSPHMKMFSDLDFSDRGMKLDLLEPLENTANTDYSSQTRSINVLSGAWVVFEETSFSGHHYVLERGLYSSPEDWGSSSSKILSVIPVILDNQSSSHFKIQLFSERDLCGSSVLLEDSLPTMPQGFIMSSCRVINGSWLAFGCEGFSGSQCVLEEGDYLDVRMMGFTQPNTSVLSLQPAGHEFSLPSIVLFERSGFRGRRTVLKSSSVNLQLTESCTRVSSILVEGGIWIVYEANNFRGSQFLLKPGEVPDWTKYSTWTRIGSLRPLIQKQVHFRLRNENAGLLMSVIGSLGDLMRIQATEETGGMDQIWMYQDGHLQCKLLADCFVDVSSGVLMAGTRAVLSSDPDKSPHLWNITSEGLIRNNAAPNLVLEVKGGQQFDKTQIILNEFHPNKLNQRWTLELL